MQRSTFSCTNKCHRLYSAATGILAREDTGKLSDEESSRGTTYRFGSRIIEPVETQTKLRSGTHFYVKFRAGHLVWFALTVCKARAKSVIRASCESRASYSDSSKRNSRMCHSWNQLTAITHIKYTRVYSFYRRMHVHVSFTERLHEACLCTSVYPVTSCSNVSRGILLNLRSPATGSRRTISVE